MTDSLTACVDSPQVAAPDLSGDRDLEWGYIAARLGRYVRKGDSILDFGCGNGMLSAAAAGLGASVLAIDLMPRRTLCADPLIEFRRADLLSMGDRDAAFDLVMNCSTIEHVGLAGRYDAVDLPDGDLQAMEKLRRLLKPGGHMLLTLPVGRDTVVGQLHRIYGTKRLPRLLLGYDILESCFWRKSSGNVWLQCPRDEAVVEEGGEHYYALGAMVLRAQSPTSPAPRN